jgi:hypothetical protein
MVAVSPSVADYLVHGIWSPANKVTLINNGFVGPAPASVDQKRAVRKALRIGPDELNSWMLLPAE